MIKYKHRNCDKSFIRATFCYELPDPSAFSILFTHTQNTISFPFGMTLVHEKDQYCKATGRDKSFKNMKITKFKLDKIEINEGRQFYYLKTQHNKHSVTLKVSTDLLNKVTPRLDYVDLKDGDIELELIRPFDWYWSLNDI